MGSRESSSNKASSDGPVPLVWHTPRDVAKERRNGLGSARRTSRNPTHHGTQCHQEVWRSHRCRILIFPGPPHQTLQGQNPRHPYGCGNWRNLDSLGASPSALAGTILQLVHLQSNHRPQGERGRRGIKQTGQHPLSSLHRAGPRGVAGGHQNRSITATNQAIRLESLPVDIYRGDGPKSVVLREC